MDENDLWDKIVKEHLLSNVYKEVSVESDKKVLKGYLRYKTIFCYQVAFDV